VLGWYIPGGHRVGELDPETGHFDKLVLSTVYLLKKRKWAVD